MPDASKDELHCPFCQVGLSITELADVDQAIECSGCGQTFYPEAATDSSEEGPPVSAAPDLDAYLDQQIHGSIPEPRQPSLKGKTAGEDSVKGWSKWEHSAPTPKKKSRDREFRRSDDYEPHPKVKPLEMLTRGKREDIGKFNEFGRKRLPEERAIDSEQRRRKELLQRGWDEVEKSRKAPRGPAIANKEGLNFDRSLHSTEERHAKPEELRMKRKDLRRERKKQTRQWKEGNDGDDGSFSMESIERAERLRGLITGLVGFVAVVAAGIVITILVADMLKDPETGLGNENYGIIGLEVYSVRDNYNAIQSKLSEFLGAEDLDAMLKLIRDRPRVEPIARSYYANQPYRPRRLRDPPALDAISIQDGFAVVPCVVGVDEKLYVSIDIEAGLKIDWESSVGYSPHSWEEIVAKKSTVTVLIRAMVEPDDFYQSAFTRSDYFSLKLLDPTGKHTFAGYLPRFGELKEEFALLLPAVLNSDAGRRSQPILATLEIKYPDFEAATNQVEISALRARGWVYRQSLFTRDTTLPLFANDAMIIGDGPRLTSDLKITDWTSADTSLEWQVAIERPVNVEVSAILANGGRATKSITLTTGPQQIQQTVPFTGDWSTSQSVTIGELEFPGPGNYTIRLKQDAESNPTQENLAILDKLVFEGSSELSGSSVKDKLLKPLIHPLSIIHDQGLENNTRDKGERALFRMLFNGTDLLGWDGYRSLKIPTGWIVEKGELVLAQPGAGPIMTTEEFDDFELKLEWKLEDGQSSGVILRTVETKGHPEETGVEIQLTSKSLEQLDPLTSNGAIKHLYEPQPFPPSPDGWNKLRIQFQGETLQYWINGTEMGYLSTFVQSVRIGSDRWNTRVKSSRVGRFQRFAKSPIGHICLEDAGTPVRFRNLKIRPIPKGG